MATLARSASGLGPINDVFGLVGEPPRQMNSGGNGGNPPGQPRGGGADSGGGTPLAPPSPIPTTSTKGGEQQPQPGGGTGTGAPPPSQYDLNSDPVLQQVNAITLLADQNAQAAALRNRQQMLLNYGDPALTASVLGTNDPYVQAAGQNQESTLAQLLRSYHHGLQSFDTNLDPSLAFSGYRISQEGQIGQSYQDSLAQAAAGLQSGLGSVTDQLNQQLAADNAQRAAALADAYQRAVQAALTNPPARGKQHAKATPGGKG